MQTRIQITIKHDNKDVLENDTLAIENEIWSGYIGEHYNIDVQIFPNEPEADHFTESRAKHPLTTKEEAERQVAEFDKVQPEDKIFRETSANKCWREMRDVDAIEAERDKYKKALEDLRDWVKHEEEIERSLAKGRSYFNVLEKIEGILEL